MSGPSAHTPSVAGAVAGAVALVALLAATGLTGWGHHRAAAFESPGATAVPPRVGGLQVLAAPSIRSSAESPSLPGGSRSAERISPLTTAVAVPEFAEVDFAALFPTAELRVQLDRVAAGLAAKRFSPRTITYDVTTAGDPKVPLEDLASLAARAYADDRGWSLHGALHFVRVPEGDPSDFTLVLAQADAIPSFSDECVYWATGEADASCTVGRFVIINELRWTDGAIDNPSYPLVDFRIQEINHETGHWLGEDHFHCSGGLAPINQQQFRFLEGCLPNAWPLPWEMALVAIRYGILDRSAIDPSAELDEQLFGDSWAVSYEPVDPQVEEPDHLAAGVDSPGNDRNVAAVSGGDEPPVDHR